MMHMASVHSEVNKLIQHILLHQNNIGCLNKIFIEDIVELLTYFMSMPCNQMKISSEMELNYYLRNFIFRQAVFDAYI